MQTRGSPAPFGASQRSSGLPNVSEVLRPAMCPIEIGPRTFIGSAALIGMAMLLIPLAHGSVAACSAFLIASQLGDLAWPVYTISERSLRQAITPNHLLGRVNSSMHLLFHGVLPLGARSLAAP